MSDRRTKGRWLLCLLGASILAAGGFLVWRAGRPGQQLSAEEVFPLPPYSESRFLNTGPEARSIGIAACAGCHTKNHQSYLLTAHSRALSDLDAKAEPPDGSFYHKPSMRSYRVYRRDNQLRHEEVLRTEEGKEIGRVDLPIRYLVGSGNFSRTYLVEVDGFLHESPITWYASKKKWDLSPGYEFPPYPGFERPVLPSCVTCHAGRVEVAGDSIHRLAFPEKAIGCENCHGPGSLHQELHRTRKLELGEEDRTIVHPGKLARERLEDVCAACHRSEAVAIPVRGRQEGDFRPGMPLTDYRIHYRFDTHNEQMTVVGHVDQLHQSACYQKSRKMTCLTCHNPHAREKPADPQAFYRQKCLGCHTIQACGLERAQRLKKDPTDNCVACHMPRGDTDIVHIAFTHHRIGRHAPKPPDVSGRIPKLVSVDDSNLPPLDRQRTLGLAYVKLSRNQGYAAYAEAFRERARGLLEGVHAAGLREGDTAQALAELYQQKDPKRARDYARQAIEAKDVSASVRGMALMQLALFEMQANNLESARGALEKLVLLRRASTDWHLLGICYLMEKQPRKALAALQRALEIRPYRRHSHEAIEQVYLQLGDVQRAREHQEKARWLSLHHLE